MRKEICRKYRPAFIDELTTIWTRCSIPLHPFRIPSGRNVMLTVNAWCTLVQSNYIEAQRNSHFFEEMALYLPRGMMWVGETGDMNTLEYICWFLVWWNLCMFPDFLISDIVSVAILKDVILQQPHGLPAYCAADVCVFPNSQFSLLTVWLRPRGWTPRIPAVNKRAKNVVVRGLRM